MEVIGYTTVRKTPMNKRADNKTDPSIDPHDGINNTIVCRGSSCKSNYRNADDPTSHRSNNVHSDDRHLGTLISTTTINDITSDNNNNTNIESNNNNNKNNDTLLFKRSKISNTDMLYTNTSSPSSSIPTDSVNRVLLSTTHNNTINNKIDENNNNNNKDNNVTDSSSQNPYFPTHNHHNNNCDRNDPNTKKNQDNRTHIKSQGDTSFNKNDKINHTHMKSPPYTNAHTETAFNEDGLNTDLPSSGRQISVPNKTHDALSSTKIPKNPKSPKNSTYVHRQRIRLLRNMTPVTTKNPNYGAEKHTNTNNLCGWYKTRKPEMTCPYSIVTPVLDLETGCAPYTNILGTSLGSGHHSQHPVRENLAFPSSTLGRAPLETKYRYNLRNRHGKGNDSDTTNPETRSSTATTLDGGRISTPKSVAATRSSTPCSTSNHSAPCSAHSPHVICIPYCSHSTPHEADVTPTNTPLSNYDDATTPFTNVSFRPVDNVINRIMQRHHIQMNETQQHVLRRNQKLDNIRIPPRPHPNALLGAKLENLFNSSHFNNDNTVVGKEFKNVMPNDKWSNNIHNERHLQKGGEGHQSMRNVNLPLEWKNPENGVVNNSDTYLDTIETMHRIHFNDIKNKYVIGDVQNEHHHHPLFGPTDLHRHHMQGTQRMHQNDRLVEANDDIHYNKVSNPGICGPDIFSVKNDNIAKTINVSESEHGFSSSVNKLQQTPNGVQVQGDNSESLKPNVFKSGEMQIIETTKTLKDSSLSMNRENNCHKCNPNEDVACEVHRTAHKTCTGNKEQEYVKTTPIICDTIHNKNSSSTNNPEFPNTFRDIVSCLDDRQSTTTSKSTARRVSDWIVFRDYKTTRRGGYGDKYNVWTKTDTPKSSVDEKTARTDPNSNKGVSIAKSVSFQSSEIPGQHQSLQGSINPNNMSVNSNYNEHFMMTNTEHDKDNNRNTNKTKNDGGNSIEINASIIDLNTNTNVGRPILRGNNPAQSRQQGQQQNDHNGQQQQQLTTSTSPNYSNSHWKFVDTTPPTQRNALYNNPNRFIPNRSSFNETHQWRPSSRDTDGRVTQWNQEVLLGTRPQSRTTKTRPTPNAKDNAQIFNLNNNNNNNNNNNKANCNYKRPPFLRIGSAGVPSGRNPSTSTRRSLGERFSFVQQCRPISRENGGSTNQNNIPPLLAPNRPLSQQTTRRRRVGGQIIDCCTMNNSNGGTAERFAGGNYFNVDDGGITSISHIIQPNTKQQQQQQHQQQQQQQQQQADYLLDLRYNNQEILDYFWSYQVMSRQLHGENRIDLDNPENTDTAKAKDGGDQIKNILGAHNNVTMSSQANLSKNRNNDVTHGGNFVAGGDQLQGTSSSPNDDENSGADVLDETMMTSEHQRRKKHLVVKLPNMMFSDL